MVNFVSKKHISPLHLAIRSNFSETALFLLKNGANPSQRDNKSNTPLHYAAKYGSYEVVKYLVETKQVELEERNQEGKIALDEAESCGHEQIRYFLELKMNPDQLFEKLRSVVQLLEQSRVELPNEYMCPITYEIMVHPTKAADGQSYEYRAISRWLATKTTSPITNQELDDCTLNPDSELRERIRQWAEDKLQEHRKTNTCKRERDREEKVEEPPTKSHHTCATTGLHKQISGCSDPGSVPDTV
eukprot:gb/GECG01009687.1/.p1 GENE.gb/GECG01009687.1/~~gb/GECG01009687.1/.p1  ORF type:complete len:245 (+),score=29.81 gb/GECG01009687.1/:1-735(+)